GIPDRHEPWLNPLVGILSGLVGSVSNLFGPPVFAYLSMRAIDKDVFIVVIAMVFLVGAVPLHGNLILLGVTTTDILILSAAASLPVFAGMALGTWLRNRFSQKMFEKILVAIIVIAGLNLVRMGLL
ncbi:MAG: TSUP family transporter, partial [Alphaproteobacteria bacterium]|nr:TSUP family transporter [Alphaproteobacteria bacterium]